MVFVLVYLSLVHLHKLGPRSHLLLRAHVEHLHEHLLPLFAPRLRSAELAYLGVALGERGFLAEEVRDFREEGELEEDRASLQVEQVYQGGLRGVGILPENALEEVKVDQLARLRLCPSFFVEDDILSLLGNSDQKPLSLSSVLLPRLVPPQLHLPPTPLFLLLLPSSLSPMVSLLLLLFLAQLRLSSVLERSLVRKEVLLLQQE